MLSISLGLDIGIVGSCSSLKKVHVVWVKFVKSQSISISLVRLSFSDFQCFGRSPTSVSFRPVE